MLLLTSIFPKGRSPSFIPSYNGGLPLFDVAYGAPINYPILHAWGLMVGKVHGPDADALMKGLNVMVLDIKLHGEKLLEGLKCPNPECSYLRLFNEKPPKYCPECGTVWGK